MGQEKEAQLREHIQRPRLWYIAPKQFILLADQVVPILKIYLYVGIPLKDEGKRYSLGNNQIKLEADKYLASKEKKT